MGMTQPKQRLTIRELSTATAVVLVLRVKAVRAPGVPG